MIKIGDHARQRYVKRVLGIEDGEKAKQYAIENIDKVTCLILDLLNNSSLLYKNYAPTRKEALDYYINGELLIKLDNNEVESMYYINLDSDKKTNSKKIKEYVNKIKQNNLRVEQINVLKEKQDENSLRLEYMIKRLQGKVAEDMIDELSKEFEESIKKCKEYAAETKKLRIDENRAMMTEMFRKPTTV
jgi:ribosomal protein S17E